MKAALAVSLLLAGTSFAQEADGGLLAEAPSAVDGGTVLPDGVVFATAAGTFRVWGSVEVFYQWNFNNPSNGLTQYVAFDTRHNAITLQNVVLGGVWEGRRAFARLTFQAGHTPFTYYLGEPALAGSSGAGGTGPQFWQFLQEAVVGYAFDDARRFRVSGGCSSHRSARSR